MRSYGPRVGFVGYLDGSIDGNIPRSIGCTGASSVGVGAVW
jgi:hypothetical protein